MLDVRKFFLKNFSLFFLLLLVIEMTTLGIIERINGPLSLLWLTNAVSIGVLLRFYLPIDWRHFCVCAVGMMTAEFLAGGGLYQTILTSGINVITIFLACSFLNRYALTSEKGEWLCSLYSVPQWLLLCQPALGIGSLLGGALLFFLYGKPYLQSSIIWYLDELLNFSVLIPAILTIPHFYKPSTQDIIRKITYILPSLLLLVAMSFIDQPLTFLLVSLLILPTLLWQALSGDLFLTTACISLNGIFFYIWTINATYSGMDIVNETYLSVIRTGVSVLALCGLTITAAIYERDKLFSQLSRIADNDYLTGILNRRAFTRKALMLTEETNDDIALILIDIDHFKKINDKWGHQKGDRILIEFCRRIKNILPKNKIFGRVGGEEFAILLTGISKNSFCDTTDLIVTEIARQPLLIGNELFPVTISAGMVRKSYGQTYETLFNLADQALYQAKNGGRNQWREYSRS